MESQHHHHLLDSATQAHTPPPPSHSDSDSDSTPTNLLPKIDGFSDASPNQDNTPPEPHFEFQEAEEDRHSLSSIFPVRRLQFPEDETTQNPSLPHAPLSERMRPRVLDEVVGQDHLLAVDSLLRSAIACGRLPSLILWGPPGTGKTSIARSIVNSSTQCRFISLSAVTCGVKDVRGVVDAARECKLESNETTVLFLDEVHRFNKSQQDSFLPAIEDGTIVFIGATTENPSFHLVTPLLSRCTVLTLDPLKPHHLATLSERAVSDIDRGLSASVKPMAKFKADHDAMDFLSLQCDGDARVALNALEDAAATAFARIKDRTMDGDGDCESPIIITINEVKEALQCKHLSYDRAGDEHYNLISALHKSMRGSDANAAMYWLARMLEGGEEPLYIARRLIRFASEDVGLADSQALPRAVSCYQACHFLGMPGCNTILAECVAYLSLAPKSVAVYRAIESARKVVRECGGQNEVVPLHLRNAPTMLMKDLGYGDGYIYPPDYPDSSQEYLPPSLQGYKFLDWP